MFDFITKKIYNNKFEIAYYSDFDLEIKKQIKMNIKMILMNI